MPLRFDETPLHAPVFQNVVSECFPGLVEVLHVVHFEISDLCRVFLRALTFILPNTFEINLSWQRWQQTNLLTQNLFGLVIYNFFQDSRLVRSSQG